MKDYVGRPSVESRTGVVTNHLGLNAEAGDEVPSSPVNVQADASDPLSLYLHLPFTPALNFSCHELAVVTHSDSDLTNYTRSLSAEIQLVASNFKTKRRAHRILIGGPCPNYLSDINFAELLSTLAHSFDFVEKAPITVHLDPRRSCRVQLELLRGLGVTDINLEVRDVDPRVQAAVGMTQSIGLIEDTISMARNLDFRSVNMDLSFGLPLQTPESIKETVRVISDLSPDLVSCQQFTRRPELFPHQRGMDSYGDLSLANRLSMFNRIVEEFDRLGWEWVGLNSFARADHVWINQGLYEPLDLGPHGYFVGQNETTLGFGVGAITETASIFARNMQSVAEWTALVARGILPYEVVKKVTNRERSLRSDLKRLLAKKPVKKDSSALTLLSSLGFPDHCYEETDLGASVQISEGGRHWLPLVWSTNDELVLAKIDV